MSVGRDTDWRQLVRRIAEPAVLDASARACGALVRAREVRDGATLLRLALSYGPGGQSLRTTAALAAANGVATLSDVALLKRLRGAAGWLEHLCSEALGRRLAASQAAATSRPIRLVDGTRIEGPGERAWRLHLCFDLAEGRLTHSAVTDLHEAERLERVPVRPGEIRIADRCYARPNGLAAVCAAGGDVIVRCSWKSLRLLTSQGAPFQLSRLFSAARHGGVAEAAVLVDKARAGAGWRPLPLRLIALHKPPDAAARSRKKARRDSIRGQAKLDPRTLEAADFLLLVTSLPAAEYPAERVLALYRLRWQIELAIKRLKSILHLDRLPAKDPGLARTWLYAHLLLALAIETVEDQLDDSPP